MADQSIRRIRAQPQTEAITSEIKKEVPGNRHLSFSRRRPQRRHLRHSQISYEIRSAVAGSETADTSIAGAYQAGSASARSASSAARTVKFTKRSVGGIRKLKAGVIKIKEEKPPVKDILKKATDRTAKKAMLKTGGKATWQGTKNAADHALYAFESPDHTNSTLGSINMTGRAVKTGVEVGVKTARAVKTGRKVYTFSKNTIKTRQAAKAAKMALKPSAVVGNTFLRSSVAKAVVAVPKVLAAIVSPPGLIICGALLLLLTITSAAGGISGVLGGVPVAEDETILQYKTRIEELDTDLNAEIESYRNSSEYDDVVIEYMGEIGTVSTNWQEILAVIAVIKENDLTFAVDEEEWLETLFNKLNRISTRTENYTCSGCESSGDGEEKSCSGHTRLYVRVYCYGIEDIINDLGLTDEQIEWAREMMTVDLAEIYPGLGLTSQGNSLSPEEIARLIMEAPTTNATRQQIYATALSLVGRVGYFWGGKSAAGWNNSWGTSVKVTAPGSERTGTYQPFGLDCSGFTDWVYKTAGVGNILSAGGTAYQWSQSYAIAEKDLKVGDLVFKQSPGTSGTNHVGIFIGKDPTTGAKLYVHCASGKGVTVDSYKGFKFYRRPFINLGD